MSFRHFTRISSVLLCRFNLKQLLTSKAFAIQSNHEKRDFWRKCEPLSFRSARVLAVCQSILVENELFWFIFLGHLCLVIIVWIFYKFLQFFELFWIFFGYFENFWNIFLREFLARSEHSTTVWQKRLKELSSILSFFLYEIQWESKVKMVETQPDPKITVTQCEPVAKSSLIVVSNRLPFVLKKNAQSGTLERHAR